MLNSKLMSFYYRKLISEAGQLFAQVKLVNLRQLPLKYIAPEEQKYFIHCVDVMLQIRTQNSEPGTQKTLLFPLNHPPGSLDTLNSREAMLCRLKTRDDMLDQKIYEVYQLTSEDIQLIEREMGTATTLYPRISLAELNRKKNKIT